MNRLGLVMLVVLAAACGDARLIRTFEDPEVDAGPDDAGVVEVHVPHDAGTPADGGTTIEAGGDDAGVTPPTDAGTQDTLDAGANATCSSDGWCLDALQPDGSRLTTHHLRSVFALDATHVYAAGDNGTVLLFDGTSWRHAPTGGPADDLFAVWASAPGDVWVAGCSGDPSQPNGVFAHFDGTQFDYIDKPLALGPAAIFGWNADDVWAVGYDGDIRHYGGSTWLAQPMATPQSLTDVTGLAGQLWAVGASGTLLQYGASGWESMVTPPGLIGGLTSIVAFSPTQLFAGGGNDWVEYDGTQWTHRNFPASLDVEMLGLWGATPARLWGVGPAGKAWKFESGVATRSDTGTTELLRDVTGLDEQHVWAVGFNGIVLRRYGP